jgi:hypothetical protein
MENLMPENLTVLHILLAYAGLVLHLLFKLRSTMSKDGHIKGSFWRNRKNLLTIVISAITIPVVLFMATDPSIAYYFPITNVTSVFAGWQTNSIFRNLMSIARPNAKVE